MICFPLFDVHHLFHTLDYIIFYIMFYIARLKWTAKYQTDSFMKYKWKFHIWSLQSCHAPYSCYAAIDRPAEILALYCNNFEQIVPLYIYCNAWPRVCDLCWVKLYAENSGILPPMDTCWTKTNLNIFIVYFVLHAYIFGSEI